MWRLGGGSGQRARRGLPAPSSFASGTSPCSNRRRSQASRPRIAPSSVMWNMVSFQLTEEQGLSLGSGPLLRRLEPRYVPPRRGTALCGAWNIPMFRPAREHSDPTSSGADRNSQTVPNRTRAHLSDALTLSSEHVMFQRGATSPSLDAPRRRPYHPADQLMNLPFRPSGFGCSVGDHRPAHARRRA